MTVPILVAFVAALVSLHVYERQRRIDRQAEVAKKRQEIYSDTLRAIMRLAEANEQIEGNKAYKAARAEIMLYGSDEVVRRMHAFSRVIDVADRAEIAARGADFAPRALSAYAALVTAMRADLYDKVTLNDEELSQLGPFK